MKTADAAGGASGGRKFQIDDPDSPRPGMGTAPVVPERARTGIRATLLELIATDDEVRAVFEDFVRQVIEAAALAGAPPDGTPHAEHHANIMKLIDDRLRQVVRQDAFRKPF